MLMRFEKEFSLVRRLGDHRIALGKQSDSFASSNNRLDKVLASGAKKKILREFNKRHALLDKMCAEMKKIDLLLEKWVNFKVGVFRDRQRLKSFEEDWNAPGMEEYDDL